MRFWPYFLLLFPILLSAQKPAASPIDPLGRQNPRSAVTAVLEACHSDDYEEAAVRIGGLSLDEVITTSGIELA